MNEAVNAGSENPSQQKLSSLLKHYQNGRLNDAEKLAVSITNEFPKHQFAWKVLGAILKQTGRVIDSLTAMQKSVQLAPHDAEAHCNLGVTLQELGRLDEALANHNQAIVLKPNYAEAHNNLGITLQKLGRLDEALASYNQAIALKPDYAGAMLNLSIIQSYMNDLEAEIVSLQNVLRIDSDDYGLRAGVNLAICNFLEGDFVESKKHLLAATKIQKKNP